MFAKEAKEIIDNAQHQLIKYDKDQQKAKKSNESKVCPILRSKGTQILHERKNSLIPIDNSFK